MITKYKLGSVSFETIKIPKGTVLFRGINFDNEYRYRNLFNDLIGYQNNKYFSIQFPMYPTL